MKNDYSQIDMVVFDLDGTIYNGDTLIDGADQVVRYFRSLGKAAFFGTNNSTKSREKIAGKLCNMGIPCEKEEVVTSSFLAAEYIEKMGLDHFFVYGTQGLIAELESRGINVCNEEDARNLLIGFNSDLDYDFISQAFRVALKAKSIIVCNLDRSYPGGDGKLYPGCGLIVSAIEWCTQRKSDITVGKPNDYMLQYLSKAANIRADRILCIGDSMETDGQMAISFGSQYRIITNGDNADPCRIGSILDLIC